MRKLLYIFAFLFTCYVSGQQEFSYGVPTIGSESAKDVLYPKGREKEEWPEVSAMYNKTHGAFGPGE